MFWPTRRQLCEGADKKGIMTTSRQGNKLWQAGSRQVQKKYGKTQQNTKKTNRKNSNNNNNNYINKNIYINKAQGDK